ncbi:MAG: DUF1631 domain-containing protein [Gammaproteobacteria bacterium]|nr:DUF1631 domain-containing protein [Gammaproteobacteria bacterium]MBI5618083.1 DUF1631 domain-containing protein [Gammaproteobacteria bacterium]
MNNGMARVSRLVPQRSVSLLTDCQRLVMDRLPVCVAVVLDKVDDAFFDLANKADSSQRQSLFFDAMRELRLKRQAMTSAFIASIKAEYDEAVNRRVTAPSTASEVGGLELSLVDPDDVEESLAITNFVESLKFRCKQELFALDIRIGHLLSDPDRTNIHNPFGPQVIGEAFKQACKILESGIEPRLTMYKMLEKIAGADIHGIYRDLNQSLIAQDVLPKLTPTFHRGGGDTGGARTRVIIETDGTREEAVGEDVFSTLQRLMTPGGTSRPGGVGVASGGAGVPGGFGMGAVPGMGGAFAAGGAAGDMVGGGLGSGAPLATAAFIGALNRLQHGDLSVLPEAIAVSAGTQIASGQSNVLSTLRTSGAIGALNQTDGLTLDVVSILFDYILDDPAIPDGMKALIGRLQIPLLKVALADKALFSKKNHPARRLLDTLAAAAVGWSPGMASPDPLYDKVESIVHRIIADYDQDVGIFEAVLSDFEFFLAGYDRETQQRAEISAKSLQTKEKVVVAKLAVDDAVKARLAGRDVRDFVRAFISDYWRQLLIITHVEAGPDSEAWQTQLGVIDDLVWSVQPKTTPVERKQLTDKLPQLLKHIKNGMRTLDMHPSDCSKFLTMLASVHVVSVKQVEEASLAERKLVAAEQAETAAAVQAQDEEAFVRKALERLFDRKSIDPVELDIDLSAFEPAATPEVTDEEPVTDEFLEAVMELDLGDWVEFTMEDTSIVRARFTWISPATGRYLFTTRQGHKALDLTMTGLTDHFRAGTARRIESQPDPIFDRAIGELMDRLEHEGG